MTPLDDLLTYLFEEMKSPLYRDFEGWVRGSRRFKAFSIEYRSKIRSKLKNVRDEGDLHAELHAAALLLTEDRFTLEYEKYAASKQRGPDFTVTFKTHTPFNVEVRRIASQGVDTRSKLMTVLCDKVGQMPPGIVNFLWMAADLTEADVKEAAAALCQMAERKDEFFTRRGFKNAGEFLKQYQYLSGIILSPSGEVWLNPLARHKPSPEIVTALKRLSKPS
jgi:hypothetical protein